MDYGSLDGFPLDFAPCADRVCTDVDIVDDFVDEDTETFIVFLEIPRLFAARIDLDPENGVVEIEDNDGNY